MKWYGCGASLTKNQHYPSNEAHASHLSPWSNHPARKDGRERLLLSLTTCTSTFRALPDAKTQRGPILKIPASISFRFTVNSTDSTDSQLIQLVAASSPFQWIFFFLCFFLYIFSCKFLTEFIEFRVLKKIENQREIKVADTEDTQIIFNAQPTMTVIWRRLIQR